MTSEPLALFQVHLPADDSFLKVQVSLVLRQLRRTFNYVEMLCKNFEEKTSHSNECSTSFKTLKISDLKDFLKCTSDLLKNQELNKTKLILNITGRNLFWTPEYLQLEHLRPLLKS